MANYQGLNSIRDPQVRNAVKNLLDRIAALERQGQSMGVVTQPLIQELNASAYRIRNIRNPEAPQDAVTLKYLQDYVANAFSAFAGIQQTQQGGGTNPGGNPGEAPADNIGDYAGLVTDIWNASPLGPTSTELDKFRFCWQVAAAIGTDASSGLVCGMLEKTSGDNIYACGGSIYSISRVCFENGHLFKVLIDADPGGSNLPTWADNSPTIGDLLPERYLTASGAPPC